MRINKLAVPMLLVGGWGLVISTAAKDRAVAKDKGVAQVAASTTTTASARSITGRVATPADQPVGGARVSLVRIDDNTRGETAVVQSTTSDAQGKFGFKPVEDVDALYEILVEATGWGIGGVRFSGKTELKEWTIRLQPVGALEVQFVDEAAQPVAELPIRIASIVQPPPDLAFLAMLPTEAKYRARTDAQGRCRIEGLPQGCQIRLDIDDKRWAQLAYEQHPRMGTGATTKADPISLVPGATVRGRIVYGPTNKPAAGVRVGAQEVSNSDWGDAVSDEDGTFVMEQLRPGSYNVALNLNGAMERDWTARAHEKLVVTQGETKSAVDFQLIKGGFIQGRVLGAQSRKPVAGVGIGIYGPAHPLSGAWVQNVQTKADGTYRARVPAGEQHVYLMGPIPKGYLQVSHTLHLRTVKEGAATTVDFQLQEAAFREVRGRVLGPGGHPVADAEIFQVATEPAYTERAVARTDARGNFRVESTNMESIVGLMARQGDMATAKLVPVRATAGKDAVARKGVTAGKSATGFLTLRMVPNGRCRLAVRVTDPNGKPIEAAQVSLFRWIHDGGHGGAPRYTDAAGQCEIDQLWGGIRYSVSASAPGFGTADTREITLTAGQRHEFEPLVLKRADSFVAGRVMDDKGEPVAGVEIQASSHENLPQRTMTDNNGAFRFKNLVPGEVSLNVIRAKGRPQNKQVAVGRDDIVIVLKANAPRLPRAA